MIYEKDETPNSNINELMLNKKIIEFLPVPIFYRDLNGKYILCNTAHNDYVNLPSTEIIGKTVYDIHTQEEADEYTRRDQELIENPETQVFETSVEKNGVKKNVLVHKVIIRDNDNNMVGIAGCITNITELRDTKKELEKAQEILEISSEMIHKTSVGIIMIDSNLKVIDSNRSFATLLGDETLELYETIPGLKNAEAEMILPPAIYKMVINLIKSGDDHLDRDLKLQNKLLHVSVTTLYENRVVGVLLRDISAPLLVRDEIINRAERINQKNIKTVQNIARLLGENASEIEELLFSIIESYKYGDEDEN